MRKRQAAISSEGRTHRKARKNVDFSSVRMCVTPRGPEEWVKDTLAHARHDLSIYFPVSPLSHRKRVSPVRGRE